MSQRIAELERAVGLTLVQRTTRSLRLTDAGQRPVDATAEWFAHIARSVSGVRDMAGQPRGLVCDSRTLLVASAGYLRRRGTPQHPSELAGHDCLAYLRSGPAQWLFEQAPVRGAYEPERVSASVQGPLRANNSELLRDAVLAGLGIARLPDFSAAAALRAGRLREVLPGWRPVGFFGDAIYAI